MRASNCVRVPVMHNACNGRARAGRESARANETHSVTESMRKLQTYSRLAFYNREIHPSTVTLAAHARRALMF